MPSNLIRLLSAGAAFLSLQSIAAPTVLQSGPRNVHLVELFTSEGCSNCPPAERRFSALKQSPKLWKEIVPAALHVDYWDNLGWRDPFGSAAFSTRQSAYAALARSRDVYTPEFVVDGSEWSGVDLEKMPGGADAGKLSASIDDAGEIHVTYQPAAGAARAWECHAAVLAMGRASDIKAGENRGRHLLHDFAALSIESAPLAPDAGAFAGVVRVERKNSRVGDAFAVWITEAHSMRPVQAAGGYL